MINYNKDIVPAGKKLVAKLNQAAGGPENRLRWRKRIYEIIEVGRGEDQISKIVDNFLIALIVLNVLAFTLETEPSIAAEYGDFLSVFNIVSVIIFTIEYIARLWTCVEVPFLRRLPAHQARLKFAMRPYLIIDLLAILPFYLSFIFAVDLRILRALRLFRFLKIARYSPALHTLTRVLFNERRALMGALLLMIGMLLFSATGIYYLERAANADAFGSIPQSSWWAMATLTTVGYGDVSPITPLGKIFGSFVMILGLAMFALPIAIISTGFAQEMARRDFVVTWSLIARVPLLAELDANEIAGVMSYLHAHNFPPHWDVITAGIDGDAMYFIASGEVLFKTSDGDITLKTGDFFGEIAMIENQAYLYSYQTLTKCKLLKLHRTDFSQLCHQHPHVGDFIRKIANTRKEARQRGEYNPELPPH